MFQYNLIELSLGSVVSHKDGIHFEIWKQQFYFNVIKFEKQVLL